MDSMNNPKVSESKTPKVTRFECPKADWIRVVNAARRTWGKEPINKEPSVKFSNYGKTFEFSKSDDC